MNETISKEELKCRLYRLDWIQILKHAVEYRPQAWGVSIGEYPLYQWRNASDTVLIALVDVLEKEGIIPDSAGKIKKKKGEARA